MEIKIYYPKDENANPYYSRNVGLKNLVNVIRELRENEDSNRLRFKRIIGGKRNESDYECELDIEVEGTLDQKAFSANWIIKTIEKNKGSYIIKGGAL